LNHLAEYGLKEVDGGWTWKFDPALFDHMEMGAAQRDTFAQLTTNTALMLGEKSEDEGAFYAEHMLAITDGLLPVITVPGTYHHLMFDQPVAVAMAMKILLLEWHRQNNHAAYQAALSAVPRAGN
jgi:hypothetical protein